MMKILYFIVVMILCNFDCMKAMDDEDQQKQKMISSGVGNPLNVYGTWGLFINSAPSEKKDVTKYSSLIKSVELLPQGIQRKIIAKIIGIFDEKPLEGILTMRYGLRLYNELKPVKIGNRNFSSIEWFRMSQKKRDKITKAASEVLYQSDDTVVINYETYQEIVNGLEEENKGIKVRVLSSRYTKGGVYGLATAASLFAILAIGCGVTSAINHDDGLFILALTFGGFSLSIPIVCCSLALDAYTDSPEIQL